MNEPASRSVRFFACRAVSVLIAILLLSLAGGQGKATLVAFSFSDPAGDHTGNVDVLDMIFILDNSTGAYTIRLTASAAAPFVGQFRINLNLYNPDAGGGRTGPGFFQKSVVFNLGSPETVLILTGINSRLTSWNAGDRVATNSQAFDLGFLYRSGVLDLPATSPLHEDRIAYGADGITTMDTVSDNDGDSYVAGADCDDMDSNNWISCATCIDSDLDGCFVGCDTYNTIEGPDCDDSDGTCALDGTTETWDWHFVGAPMDDPYINVIRVDPDDDNLWYVGSENMYITRDAGASWENHNLSESTYDKVSNIEIDPNSPNRVFATSNYTLYRSDNHGQSWDPVHTFAQGITSILVSSIDGSVYVGVGWGDDPTPNGMYKSTDLGKTFNLYSYGDVEQGLIPWDIEEDPVNNILYVGTEIYDHPSPYDPPYLRSLDGGVTWEEISGALPWHVVKTQVDPSTQDVYVLTEGAGLYRSSDFGNTWRWLSNDFMLDLVIDQKFPNRFFGGNHTYGGRSGGVYYSTDKGKDFTFVGPPDVVMAGLSLNDSSTRLYAAGLGSGVYVTSICDDVLPTVSLNSPNGVVLCPGMTETVTWTSSDQFFYNFVVEFSADDGENWAILGEGSAAGTCGNLDWNVPSLTTTGLVRVTVTNCAGSASDTVLFELGVLRAYYSDRDGDNYGDPNIMTQACGPPIGYVADGTDCDDNDGSVHPDATEVCNGVDDDCDDIVDDGDSDQDSLVNCMDNCPDVQNLDQSDFDGDGIGNACEVGAVLADSNQSGRADGGDLVELARAFAACTNDTSYDESVDLDWSGCVDGDDLAILAQFFGQEIHELDLVK